MSPRFQVGGVLVGADALYVERAGADGALRQALLDGELCHVLAPRQIGKSSLRVRTAGWLEARGRRCAQVDLTALGSQGTTEQWYFGLVDELAQAFDLGDPEPFWTSHPRLAPVARWVAFVERVLVPGVDAPLVVFLDEIDFVRTLGGDGDDFLSSIRALAEAPAVRARLSFCLIGVAAPSALIRDPDRTPFNVGCHVRVEDFTRAEMQALAPGLAAAGLDPDPLLDAVHVWTAGHPYMTAKVCDALCRQGGDVDAVVSALFLERPFDDFNLKYAQDRFELDLPEAPVLRKLSLYRQALLEGRVPAAEADRVEAELVLAGMLKRTQGAWLTVRNRVFAEVFGREWIRARQTRRDFADALMRWLAAPLDDRAHHVLRGRALDEARAWALGRRDLTPDEERFLRASAETQAREARERAALQARAAWALGVATVLAIVLAGMGFALWRSSRAGEAVAVEAARKAEAWAQAAQRYRAARVEREAKLAELTRTLAALETRAATCAELEQQVEVVRQANAAVERTEAAAELAGAQSSAASAPLKTREELQQDVRDASASRLALQGALNETRNHTEHLRNRVRDLERMLVGAREHATYLEGMVDERDGAIADLEDRLRDARDEARRPAPLRRVAWSGAKVRYDSLGDAAAEIARVAPDVRGCAVRTALDCPEGMVACPRRVLLECEAPASRRDAPRLDSDASQRLGSPP